MRIIHAAKKVQETEITCFNCKSVLGVEEADLVLNGNDYCVKCPVCKEVIRSINKRVAFPWVMEDKDEVQSDNFMRVN